MQSIAETFIISLRFFASLRENINLGQGSRLGVSSPNALGIGAASFFAETETEAKSERKKI